MIRAVELRTLPGSGSVSRWERSHMFREQRAEETDRTPNALLCVPGIILVAVVGFDSMGVILPMDIKQLPVGNLDQLTTRRCNWLRAAFREAVTLRTHAYKGKVNPYTVLVTDPATLWIFSGLA
ncbi:uncharacterized protein BDCG_02722 [Blastomyces dermatitidis ER-3]|uniref:Uncharacterized protein n=1 Tax=Ajellomyces dermatitidis (strain ER-3 / ATCC MYA-2586) TaxID=559297 RepID=A0ABP2EUK3_AJEDR|nr:uncharacterized protein BDCG_02722 [Blastomyces dermatitidis ER-3]EEQ87602.1 hypothetical protein BDCG_02722 [Blastomyces dermatitidis ER-3]